MTLRPFGSAACLLALLTPLAFQSVGATSGAYQGPVAGQEAGSQEDFASVRERAEALIEQGAFALAEEAYAEFDPARLTPDQARWVRFRRADCAWRAQIGEKGTNGEVLAAAGETLAAMVDEPAEADRDPIWAEAGASLADLLDRRRSVAEAALERYRAVLRYWERSSDIEVARRHYLDLAQRLGFGPQPGGPSAMGLWGQRRVREIPIEILRKAARIAVTPEDQAATQYLLAQAYLNRSRDLAVRGRAERAYRAVLALGKGVPLYDASLIQLAQHLSLVGRPERSEDGTLTFQPDYVGALALYRRLLAEFEPGESGWRVTAHQAVQSILAEQLSLSVRGAFLPGTTPTFELRSRNLPRVDLALYAVDLNRDVNFGAQHGWLEALPLSDREPLRTWTIEPEGVASHRSAQAEHRIEDPLPNGAFVLTARGGGESARALVLVSDLALTLKGTADGVLVWAADAVSGAPVAGADVVLHSSSGAGSEHRLDILRGTTTEDGTLFVSVPHYDQNYRILCTASSGDAQAWSDGWGAPWSDGSTWRLFPHTDRPAYRPGQTVHWKLVARRAGPDGLTTPTGEKLDWVVRDPRGTEWERGSLVLDAFGGAAGELETDLGMPLGAYSVRVEAGGQWIADATLFRLEEYELPEYEVLVKPATKEDGSPLRFAPGDTLEADILAHYTSGGPVQGARVEVTVSRASLYYAPRIASQMPWFEDTWTRRPYFSWTIDVIANQTLWTDEQGRAHLSVDTEFDDSQDITYRIQARVIDASRREIVGSGSVRGTRTPYFVALHPRRRIGRPAEDSVIEIHTETADHIPVAAKGRITCLKQTFVQRWIARDGRPVVEHERIDGRALGMRFVSEETEETVVLTEEVETDAAGDGVWRFRPSEAGSYLLRWHSPGDREMDVTAETQLYVADDATRSLGVVSGGIEILVNEDSVEPGREATLILLAPTSGRFVLLTTETETIDSHRVLHMAGTVEVVHIPITTAHIPNLWVAAVSLANGQSFRDEVELRVPPVDSVLDVSLNPDREEMRPGEEGSFTLSVRDADGEPVEAQLSLAVIDESLLAIQGDLAGDPRTIFLGTPRRHGVYTSASQDQGPYRGAKDADSPGPDDTGGGHVYSPVETEELASMGYTGGTADGFALRVGVNSASGEGVPGDFDDVIGIGGGAGGKFGARSLGVPKLRKDFRETALWLPDVVTDAEGKATVKLTYPDSTTRWRALSRAADRGGRFGVGEVKTHTKLPLTTRLTVPRFLTVGDEATLSCNLVNESDEAMELAVSLEVEGLERADPQDEGHTQEVTVPAHAAKRLDWSVAAREAGEAVVRVAAAVRGGEEAGDAMERRFRVQPHGIEVLVAKTGRFAGPAYDVDLDIPAARDAATTKLSIQVTPNLAVTMLDALPYLADYPYGCTEQTLSRFVPSVVVAKTLRDLGLDPDEALERRFGGIDEEFAAVTHGGKERDLSSLDKMTAAGLARLIDYQHASGAFGWWKMGPDDPYMTAYALYALSLARDGGVDVPGGMLQRAAKYLSLHLVEERDLDRLAFSLLALTTYGGPHPDTGDSKSTFWIERGFDRLREHPGETSAYGSALFALAAHRAGHEALARAAVATLLNGVVVDEEPDRSILQGGRTDPEHVLRTAHWGHESFFRWSSSAVESTAFVVLALTEVDPENSLLEPAVQWLVQNRRGSQWSNTRATALTVLALSSYLKLKGSVAEPVAFEVEVNGRSVGKVRLEASDMLHAPSRFEVDPSWIVDGMNRIRIVRSEGDSALTVAASATFFSLEEPIPARGSVLFVHRRYERLVGRPTLLSGVVFDHVPLHDGDRVETGDRIESVLVLEAKNDLEYVLVEDWKPAGLEAVETKSGWSPIHSVRRSDVERLLGAESGVGPLPADLDGGGGRAAFARREIRTNRIATFIDRMGEGFWEVRTMFVARTPGSFHALPALGEAMYVPEIRSNGRELRMGVE